MTQSSIGIALFDPSGRLNIANPIFHRLLGLEKAEESALSSHPFFAETALDQAVVRCVEEQRPQTLEVSYSGSQPGKQPDQQSEQQSEKHRNGLPGQKPGQRAKPLRLRIHLAPVSLVNGVVDAVQAIFEDVTEHQEFERQSSHRQKLEAVGALASGIAHEINTPIQFIGDNTYFLTDSFQDLLSLLTVYQQAFQTLNTAEAQRRHPELSARVAEAEAAVGLDYLRDEIPAALDHTAEGVARVAEIVNAMRTFAHPVTGSKSPADLNTAIQHTLTVARNEYKYVADIVLDLDPDLPMVWCDLGEVNQVFLNLIVNAAHTIEERRKENALPGRGTISLTTRRDDDHVVISIGDTGMGIPPAVRDRIFDPFFTTKPVGEGTGQGLAIAHGIIVSKHQGQIQIETEMGEGTTFHLRLPIHPPEEAPDEQTEGDRE